MASMAVAAAIDAKPEVNIREFEAWLGAEQHRILLLCLRLLGNAEDADIATQDTFLKAYRALEHGEGPTLNDPAKWLTRIAVNTCLDRLRSLRWQFWKRRPAPEDECTILALAPAAGPSPEQAFFASQIGGRLKKALGRLSDQQRSVFVLKHYEDRSLQEIAEVLNLSVGTVKAHMARAIAKLRLELKDLYGK